MATKRKIQWVGLELLPSSIEDILKLLPPEHVTLYAHHVTLSFGPSQDQLSQIPFDKEWECNVTGYISTPNLKAAVVEFDALPPGSGFKREPNHVYHVTISCAEGIKPVESNRALTANNGVGIINLESPLRIKGIIKAFY